MLSFCELAIKMSAESTSFDVLKNCLTQASNIMKDAKKHILHFYSIFSHQLKIPLRNNESFVDSLGTLVHESHI